MRSEISAQRRAANIANAAKSTGPRTEAGKAASRGNAYKHGMRATVVVTEDEDLLHERAIGVHQTFKPQNAFQAWICVTIAIISIRLDRLRDLERQIRKGASWRASQCWDEDQRREANRIGGRLARNPEQVVGQLRRSAHGCDWLIERWVMLASVADRGHWTDEQKVLANDLLGTPHEFRDDAPGFTVDADGRTIATGADEAGLARVMLADLRLHQERITEADEIARNLAIADLDDFNNRDLIRFGRYERSLQREFHRLCTLSQFESPHDAPIAQILPSIPAQLLESLTEPNEPIPAPAAPEAPIEPSSISPNEPTPAVVYPGPNEPILAATPPGPNEPNPEVEVVAVAVAEPTIGTISPGPNEPIVSLSPPRKLAPTGINPELLALLEADLPDPDTLDPAWCRQFLAATLGFDDTGQLRLPD